MVASSGRMPTMKKPVLAAVAAGCLSLSAAELSVEEFVRGNVLPFKGIAASSAACAEREVDELDVTCDEMWLSVSSKAEYDACRTALRARMLAALGTMPPRTPLCARTVSTMPRDGYSIEKVLFESMPGLLVSANLFVPGGAGRHPAIVMSCGHSDRGKDCATYLRACVIAAKRGFVVFMFDPYNQGERTWSNQGTSTFEHTQMGLRASLIDWSAPLLRIWDAVRAIDYVSARPEVDPARIGYMGQSGGGTMTALVMAADERVRAAAPSCYLTSLRALCHDMGPQDGEQNIYGQLAFGLNHTGYVLIPDIPVAVTCKFADMFPYSGVCTLFRTVRAVERNLGLGDRAFLNVAPGGHGWTEATETASVTYLARHLIPDGRDAAIDMEGLWLLDLGYDVENVERGLSEDEVGCTPGYSTEKAGSRHIRDIICERYKDLAAGAGTLDAAAKRAAAARLAKVRGASATGYRAKETFSGRIGDVEASRIVVQYPKTGHALPAVVLKRANAEKAPVLVTAYEGRAQGLALARPYLDDGHPVVIADVSGTGEVGSPLHLFYGQKNRPDEGLGAMCFLLGEPLVGRRATDILVLAEVTGRRFGGERPLLVASGPLAIPAAHAYAAGAEAFSGVRLEAPPPGWADVLSGGSADGTVLYYADIVPQAALSYDWPELIR